MALNDSKREAALKDLLADSQEEHFSRFPKAPRLDPKSPEREICQVDGDGAENGECLGSFQHRRA